MRAHDSINIYPPVLAQLVVVLCAVLAGCSQTAVQSRSTSQNNILELESALLPSYQAGTKFIYSDGTWEKVVGSGTNLVKWTNQNGFFSEGTPDFTYGRTEWHNSQRHGTRTFKQTEYLLHKPAMTLWPLAVGNTARFEESARWSEKNGAEHKYSASWRCEVQDTETLRVAAGSFAVWKITCARYPGNMHNPGTKAREYKTWYFAPTIGHWVLELRDFNNGNPANRRELVAVLPDMEALSRNDEKVRELKKHFQNTLEWQKSEMIDNWRGGDRNLAVSLTPRKTFRTVDGTLCRQYVQHITTEESMRDYYGIACKDPEGSWRIPR